MCFASNLDSLSTLSPIISGISIRRTLDLECVLDSRSCSLSLSVLSLQNRQGPRGAAVRARRHQNAVHAQSPQPAELLSGWLSID